LNIPFSLFKLSHLSSKSFNLESNRYLDFLTQTLFAN